jgi:hypothetical protein
MSAAVNEKEKEILGKNPSPVSVQLLLTLKHTHTKTHTHTHARTLACTHARTHARTQHTHTRTHTHTVTHCHTRAREYFSSNLNSSTRGNLTQFQFLCFFLCCIRSRLCLIASVDSHHKQCQTNRKESRPIQRHCPAFSKQAKTARIEKMKYLCWLLNVILFHYFLFPFLFSRFNHYSNRFTVFVPSN